MRKRASLQRYSDGRRPTKGVGSQSRGPSGNLPLGGAVFGMHRKRYPSGTKVGDIPGIVPLGSRSTRSPFSPQGFFGLKKIPLMVSRSIFGQIFSRAPATIPSRNPRGSHQPARGGRVDRRSYTISRHGTEVAAPRSGGFPTEGRTGKDRGSLPVVSGQLFGQLNGPLFQRIRQIRRKLGV